MKWFLIGKLSCTVFLSGYFHDGFSLGYFLGGFSSGYFHGGFSLGYFYGGFSPGYFHGDFSLQYFELHEGSFSLGRSSRSSESLLQGQLSVLTHISVSVSPLCYRSSR